MLVPRPARPSLILAALAATLVLAACNHGAGGGATATGGATTPSPATTTGPGGGGYGGGYGGGNDFATTPPASPAASEGASAYEIKAANSATVGTYLVGEDGRTLYIFDRDSATTSACSGGCAQAWPPFVVEGAEAATAGDGVTGALATIARDDGTTQVTYAGHPLYYYAADTKAGDTTGDGVNGVWHVAKP